MVKRAELRSRLDYALAWVRGRTDVRPLAGVILGSGLSGFAERLGNQTVIPYSEIPEFPVSRVPGHPARLVLGELPPPPGKSRPVPVAALLGRVHAYEGWSADEVAFGARVLCGLGAKSLVLTNAAGGINAEYEAGDLVRITDHLNLSGQNPLTGPNDDRIGTRFPDLTQAYHPCLGELLDDAARRLGIQLKRGVYACMSGPSYETPAEVRMLRVLGADLVGMSTVHEVIAARHMNVPVAAISVVANRAAGLAGEPLSHAEVQAVAARVGTTLGKLLEAYLPTAVP
jgi:purine-nucleoside phosphorylase